MSSADHISEFAFTISTLTVPESVHAPDAADFLGMAEVRNSVEAELRGSSDVVMTAEELLPSGGTSRCPCPGWSPSSAAGLSGLAV